MDESPQLPCSGKLAFDTKKEAEAVAVTSHWKYGNDTQLRAYKCQHCGLWHLASNYE